ncbi:MAG: hypothetical protein M3256_20825, partial [Actinomycetota bacterium]|nr:hypothetical protein [Actinomycetota bacterium]
MRSTRPLVRAALKQFRRMVDRTRMRWFTLGHKRRRWARLAALVDVFWLCRCAYHNVATYRCFGCGRRPPRELFSRLVARSEV